MTEETFKGAVHAGMATMLGVMLAYNLMRLCRDGERRRNVVNCCIYAPLLVHEWRQARHHWRREREAQAR